MNAKHRHTFCKRHFLITSIFKSLYFQKFGLIFVCTTLCQNTRYTNFLEAHSFFDKIKQILDTPGLNKDLLLIHLPIFSVTPNIQHYLQVFMLNENVIPRNQIEIVSKLSSGQFGYVYKGKSNTIRLSLNKNWTSQKWHSTCALINHLLN